jgi:hypothetical protein
MYIPPGFNTVTPYFFVAKAEAFVRFLVHGLGGTETCRTLRPNGLIANVSTTDLDAQRAHKRHGPAAMGGDPVNGLMETRHRLLRGIPVESVRGPASEREGGRDLIEAFHHTHRRRSHTGGADKGYFATPVLTARFRRRSRPPIAAKTTGREAVHQRVRRRGRTAGSRLSPRARKKIEALGGAAKGWHGFRRFQRRGLLQVRDDA